MVEPLRDRLGDPFRRLQVARRVDVEPARYFLNNGGKYQVPGDAATEPGWARLVFSSTCAVYGTPERVPVGENAPVHPESPYGESKAMTGEGWAGTTDAWVFARSACAISMPPGRGLTGRSGRTGPSRSI